MSKQRQARLSKDLCDGGGQIIQVTAEETRFKLVTCPVCRRQNLSGQEVYGLRYGDDADVLRVPDHRARVLYAASGAPQGPTNGATHEGNGHTIADGMADRPGSGLFGRLTATELHAAAVKAAVENADVWLNELAEIERSDDEIGRPWRAMRPGVSVPRDLFEVYRQAGGPSPSRILAEAMRRWLEEHGIVPPPPPPPSKTDAATQAAQQAALERRGKR
jgi:hypothetical protein